MTVYVIALTPQDALECCRQAELNHTSKNVVCVITNDPPDVLRGRTWSDGDQIIWHAEGWRGIHAEKAVEILRTMGAP